VHARYNLGSVLRSQGRFEEAADQFKQIIQTRPDHVPAHCGLGLTFQSQGRFAEAIDRYRRALEIEPSCAEAHSNLADLLSGQNKSDEAIVHYRRALRADPNYVHAHCNLGVELSAAGQLNEAVEHFRRALQIDPQYTEAHNNLASLLLARGKLDEAIGQYRLALHARADYQAPVRLDKEVNRYARALRPAPDYARIHHNLGRALVTAGDLSGALEHFKQAARLKPNWPVPLNDAARIMTTHPDAKVRNADEAVRLAERAAALTGYKSISILDTLAFAYAKAGQFDRAVVTAETAVELASGERADRLAEQLELYKQGKF
jgi:tetratricopeptide (TPR) repeat protein